MSSIFDTEVYDAICKKCVVTFQFVGGGLCTPVSRDTLPRRLSTRPISVKPKSSNPARMTCFTNRQSSRPVDASTAMASVRTSARRLPKEKLHCSKLSRWHEFRRRQSCHSPDSIPSCMKMAQVPWPLISIGGTAMVAPDFSAAATAASMSSTRV